MDNVISNNVQIHNKEEIKILADVIGYHAQVVNQELMEFVNVQQD
jgi:hypothetical protein